VSIALAWPSTARAHSTTFAVYSKYEATASGRDIAFVFALDKAAVLQLLERELVHTKVDLGALERYRPAFSAYLFARFFVSNNGAPCSHPDQLARFFWDQPTGRVLAVTKYSCAADLSQLTIRSRLTHDMPIAHELVGDLQYGRTLERSFFAQEDSEAHLSLASQPRAQTPLAKPSRGKFSYVALPDRQRRYEALAQAELGIGSSGEPPVDSHPARTLFHFIGQGILHIFTGYDHVLFIVTLMLVVGSWRKLAVIVTSFTAAHSITLILATLGVVTIPARVVEPLIALSVLLVAVDALARPNASARAAVTFAFGLLHGFGLSNVLRALGLHGRELVPALLGFNAGVEVGQLLIVTPLFPLVLVLRKDPPTYARARQILCASVALLAVFWIVQRIGAAMNG
jgi:hydrogenase/urease accessory protein HupE